MLFARHVGHPAFNDALDIVADQRPDNGRQGNGKQGDAQHNHRQAKISGHGGVREDVAKGHGGHDLKREIERCGQVGDWRCELLPQVQRAQRAVDGQRGQADDCKKAAGGQAVVVKPSPVIKQHGDAD